MFELLAPGNLVLTLQSKPPFVLESAFAVALTVLLAAPLIARVYFLFDKPLKNFTKRSTSSCRRRRRGRSSESLVIRYPARKIADATSSSDLRPETIGQINSTSVVRGDDGVSRNSSRHVDNNRKKIEARESRRRKRPSLNRLPSSIPTTDAACRIVDLVSDLDYKAYRHRLIEASLRKQYDDYQPPGDVVLNSLHLNSADSVIGVQLDDHYDHSLFDFVEEYYDVSKATNGQNAGHRPHPLDHFLVKGSRRPKTAERQTETASRLSEDDADRESFDREGARDYSPVSVDGGHPRPPGVDNNGNPCVRPSSRSASIEDNVIGGRNDLDSRSEAPRERAIPTQSRIRASRETCKNNWKEDRTRRKSPWIWRNRSASVGGASTPVPRISALSRAAALPRSRRLIKSAERPTSADRFGGSAKKLEDRPDKPAQSSSPSRKRAGRQEATANFFSRSSSEIVSVCSEHSDGKHRDEMSCRSRESSISPKSPKSRARPPWLSANRGGSSFNRKYGNIAKNSARTGRPMLAARGSSLPRKLTVPSGGRSSKEPSPAPASRDPTSLGLRAASFIAPREREFIRAPAEQEREQDLTATYPCRQQDDGKLQEEEKEEKEEEEEGAGRSVALENDEKTRIPRTLGSPDEEISASRPAISRFPDNTAFSFSSPRMPRTTRAHADRRSQAAVAADASSAAATSAASSRQSRTTQKPGLSARFVPGPGKRQVVRNTRATSGHSKSPLMQDRRANAARLNRGEGQRAANSAFAKGASLNSKIELSGQVLNSADDTDDEQRQQHGAPVDSAKLVKRAPQRAPSPPRRQDAEATGSDGGGGGARAVPGVKNAGEETTAKNDASSNNSGRGAARCSKVPEIIRNLRACGGGADDLAGRREPAPPGAGYSSTARRNANAETKSGLSGAKLNGRSNDALCGMKRDESTAGSALSADDSTVDQEKEREGCAEEAIDAGEEELKLPRHDSKIGLAMNSALRRYIRTLKRGLLDRSNKDGIALASLSLTDAISILSGERAPLSAEETRELQSVLSKFERNPELLRRESLSGMR